MADVADVAERLRGLANCEVCSDDRSETLAAALERVLRRGERTEASAAVRELDEHLLTERLLDIYRSVLEPAAPRPAELSAH